MEIEMAHNDTLATLQEEHARTVKSKHLDHVALFDWHTLLQVKRNNNMSFLVSDLKMAHEQQTKSLEEEFEKIRLSLQVNTALFFKQIKCMIYLVVSESD